MSQDTFLICRNCRNWGQAWQYNKKTIICEKRQDVSGRLYTPQHPACRHFVPILTSLPEDLQKIRLFVQTLSLSQQSYFAWSLSQASLLLGFKDADGRKLSLGDQVTFRLGLCGHTGTVEGVDPQHKKAIIVSSPSFVNSSISLLASSLTKISKEKAKEIVNEFFPEEKNKIKWHIKSLVDEITILRSRQETWTKDDYLAVILYEQQLLNLDVHLQYAALQASI